MKILVDDFRTMGKDEVDIIIRDAETAIRILNWADYSDEPVYLILDHDLGIDEATGEPETGMQVLDALNRYNSLPKHVELYTQNPVGRARMEAALKTWGYKPERNYFIKV